MNIRLLDIGGSGVKTAKLRLSEIPSSLPGMQTQHFDHPNWNDFAGWLADEGLLDCEVIGISCAGFITLDGMVKLCRVAGWRHKPLAREIQARTPGTRIFMLNDAEAHLMAHVPIERCPLITLALGTSLGCAMADEKGRLIRALDGLNFDFGELPLPTSAQEKKVWWALGSEGLAALQHQYGDQPGAERYGYRLGAFAATLCGLFRPQTIVLSGGITARWWDSFHTAMASEFQQSKPGWTPPTILSRSPYPREAALIGMAHYSAHQLQS